MLTFKIGLILAALLAVTGWIGHMNNKRRIEKKEMSLQLQRDGYAYVLKEEEKEEQRREEEERLLQSRKFSLNFLLTHGSAFGGFSAILSDGKTRRGKVALSEIMMYGTHPSGKEFTYYIEDQGIEICASDQPDELLIRSTDGHPFEIREEGEPRDMGARTEGVIIRKDILYYVILESKHELSMRATAC